MRSGFASSSARTVGSRSSSRSKRSTASSRHCSTRCKRTAQALKSHVRGQSTYPIDVAALLTSANHIQLVSYWVYWHGYGELTAALGKRRKVERMFPRRGRNGVMVETDDLLDVVHGCLFSAHRLRRIVSINPAPLKSSSADRVVVRRESTRTSRRSAPSYVCAWAGPTRFPKSSRPSWLWARRERAEGRSQANPHKNRG